MKSQAASDVMGHGAPELKPVSKSDKAMSKMHKAHRKDVEKMSDSTPAEKVAKLKAGIRYNDVHAKQHNKASVRDRKVLRKMGVKSV